MSEAVTIVVLVVGLLGIPYLVAIFFELPVNFVGALVGLMWPTTSPEWRRTRNRAAGLGLAAVVLLGLSATAHWLDAGRILIYAALAPGIALLIGFLVLGNLCRKFHETQFEQRRRTSQQPTKIPPLA